jgi:hypothetical protein
MMDDVLRDRVRRPPLHLDAQNSVLDPEKVYLCLEPVDHLLAIPLRACVRLAQVTGTELKPTNAAFTLGLELVELALDCLDAAYQAVECLADLGQDRRDLGGGGDGGIAIVGVSGAGECELVRALVANFSLGLRREALALGLHALPLFLRLALPLRISIFDWTWVRHQRMTQVRASDGGLNRRVLALPRNLDWRHVTHLSSPTRAALHIKPH